LVFSLTPYSKSVARSLLKEPKYYLYDLAQAGETEAQKIENLVALSIKKQLDFLSNTEGKSYKFHYLRTKDGKEIDFYVYLNPDREYLIEVKLGDDTASPNFNHFAQFFPGAKKLQLVKNLAREKTYPNGVEIRNLINWLSEMPI
jgi:uncharacterized protein